MGKHLLPFSIGLSTECTRHEWDSHRSCFLASDHRDNEQLALTAMCSTVVLGQWQGCYRGVCAQSPLGWRHPLSGSQEDYGCFSTSPTITDCPRSWGNLAGRCWRMTRATTSMQMQGSLTLGTAAFTFGHTSINPILSRLNDTFGEVPEGYLPLRKTSFSPFRIVKEGGINQLFQGLFSVGV